MDTSCHIICRNSFFFALSSLYDIISFSTSNSSNIFSLLSCKILIDAFLAKDQKCCGAPAYFTGDFDTVDYNAKHNIEYFENFGDDIEAIIVPEATCSAMLKIDYEHYFHDQPEWKARAKAVMSKVFMATEWLQNHTELEQLLASKKKAPQIVTYHDPCHAKKMQGIYEEPRNLIRQNYKIVEMSDPNTCCGFGGITMQTEKYHFAKAPSVIS